MLTSESIRFRQLESLFDQAIEIDDPVERDLFLASACQDDVLLLREVSSLLEYEREIHPQTSLPAFGPYQATRLIGRGGMGAVYEAVRVDGEFERTVAVKVMSGWALSPAAREHFRRERQILAYLDHPGIVRLFDGGVSADGSPYLAMELVEGERIDVYCQKRQSTSEARHVLLRELLDAVEYAHRQGVIHRDIKPSNVLVDDSGRVRVVDFGTARLIDPIQSIEGRPLTQMRAISADYASPELASGTPVDERTDIYSLGVVCRELLGDSEVARKATAADPAARFADAGAFREALQGRPRNWRPWAGVAAAAVAACVAVPLWIESSTAPRAAASSIRIEHAQHPSISGDGRWIGFESGNPAPRIWLSDSERKRPAIRVTSDEVRETQPALAPDGSFLLFRSDRNPPGVYRVDLKNGVPSGSAKSIAPGGFLSRISPDSRWLAFSGSNYNRADSKVGAEVFVVRADGGEPRKVSPHAVQHVAWMPGNRGLVLGFVPSWGLSNATIKLAGVTWTQDSIANPTVTPLGIVPFVDQKGLICGQDRLGRIWTASPPSKSGFTATVFRLPKDASGPLLEVARHPLAGSVADGCANITDDTTAYFSHRNESAVFELEGNTDLAHFPAGTPKFLERPATFAHAPDTSADGSVVVWMNMQGAENRFATFHHRPSGKIETVPAEAVKLAADGKSTYVLHNGSWMRKSLDGPTPTGGHTIQTLRNVWNFSPSGRHALVPALILTSRFISLVDTETGATTPILQYLNDPLVNLYLASFSLDERWILFTAEGGTQPTRVFIAPFRGRQLIPQSEWIEVGRGDYPAWAPGGNRVYFAANAGLETVALDPATKRPAGSAKRVQELNHEAGWSLRGVPPGYFRIAVSRNKLTYILGRRDALVEVVRH